MKIYFFLFIAVASLISCGENSGTTAETKNRKGLIARNTSINAANSYSDLFLDSAAVEQFITQQKLSDTAADGLRNFYNARNFQYGWFTSDGLTEQALAFRSLYDFTDTSDSRRTLDETLDNLMANDSLRVAAGSHLKTELMLTWRFVNFTWNEFKEEKIRDAAITTLAPSKKNNITATTDLVLSGKEYDKIAANDWYPPLRDQLKKYADIAKNGGWPTIPAPPKKGKISDSAIVLVKKRLQITGDLSGNDTTNSMTPELEAAIRRFQDLHGMTTDGKINAAVVKEMNVSANERLKQILVNLERARWMPALKNGRTIIVNIPEFRLHVKEGADSVFSMSIVVGKEGHSTVMFTGELNQVVFSPYWNLPESIVKNEVLPKLEGNSQYLAEHNMEMTGERNGVPVIRQLPGEKNELGKVKFLFPNSFNIYFHDTPHKDLFNLAKRDYSHGCIRLSEPKKLAEYLLKDQSEWSSEKIDEAMNKGEEKFVRVKEPAHVMISYFTCWTDGQGNLQWRNDIYGHDEKMGAKLFTGN